MLLIVTVVRLSLSILLPSISVKFPVLQILIFIVATLSVLQVSLAATYRYNENAPPAKMMLDMMAVMGVIERVPDTYRGNRRTWPVSSLWGMNPSAMRPGAMNPMLGTSAPWRIGAAGLPRQLPANRFYPQPMPALPNHIRNYPAPPPYLRQQPVVAKSPIHTEPRPKQMNKLVADALWSTNTIERQLAEIERSTLEDRASLEAIDTVRPRNSPAESLAGSLQGLWLGEHQAVLEFTDNRFVWTTASGITHSGLYQFDGKILTTAIEAYKALVRYQIELTDDQLVATSESGHRYVFKR